MYYLFNLTIIFILIFYIYYLNYIFIYVLI